MGILNLSTDSFYDGGRINSEKDLLNHTVKMIQEGAAIIDTGAQSTRPGARLISADDEWKLLSHPLSLLRREFPDAILSVDTFHATVAENAAGEGIDIINDVSGGNMDERMLEKIGRLKIPYVLMHMKGTPQTMQQNPFYEDVTREVMRFFSAAILKLTSLGVSDIIIDPGFGFGKTLEHNYDLLSNLEKFKIFERPILTGFSRKSMVNKVTGTTAEHGLNGTTVLNTLALQNGANILRVHDVKEAVEATKIIARISKS